MTLDELRERIKNEVVLQEGEVADWQWRQKGLVDEATGLGILPSDFNRLVVDVSRQLNHDFGKILDLKQKIVSLAQQRQKKLTESDMDQLVSEGERIQLSRAFITEQWVPAILSTVPDAPSAPVAPVVDAPVAPMPAETPRQPVSQPESVEPRESVQRRIAAILDEYDKHIPSQSLKFLFKAISYDEAALAEEIRSYLSEHYYASVDAPKGSTLKDKLISTDWRHLSWWEKEPAQTPATGYVKTATGYTTTPATPPPVAPPPVITKTTPQRKGMSDATVIGMAVVAALILIWVVMSLTKSSPTNATETGGEAKPANSTVEKTSKAVEGKGRRPKGATHRNVKKRPVPNQTDDEFANTGSSAQSAASAPKSYDEVREEGDFDLRAARKGSRWGYINEYNQWIVKPQFDKAEPFRNGRAAVVLDGERVFIDQRGTVIRE